MRINKNLEKVLLILLTIAIFIGGFIAIVYGFLWIAQFIWFLQDNNFFGFPIWTFLIVLFVIAAFINNVYNELKFNKKEPTRKNVIAQTKLSIIIFTLFSLVAALAIYLINLWYGFIFIFLIGGFLYTFTKNFREK
tara:strand:+ start:123 stop:530 length:408 start_codon:yes stop_codon:yes gene_type:complete